MARVVEKSIEKNLSWPIFMSPSLKAMLNVLNNAGNSRESYKTIAYHCCFSAADHIQNRFIEVAGEKTRVYFAKFYQSPRKLKQGFMTVEAKILL